MATLGVFDVSPLGKMLARKLEASGATVAVADSQPEIASAFVGELGDKRVVACPGIPELVAAVERPRKIFVSTETGPKVDAALDALAAHLNPGDVVIHAGNERHEATTRRAASLTARGIGLVGLGVGLGPEVARHGSSLMVGASAEDFTKVQPLLAPLAAKLPDGLCLDRLGPPATGHFVKVALMGIEYAEMHMIAEIADVLRRAGGLANDAIGAAFDEWNTAELESQFMTATSKIFRKVDESTGKSVIDLIVDTSGMKPMGQWMVQSAFELGSPMPTLAAALASRMLMAMRPQRLAASKVIGAPPAVATGDNASFVVDARAALRAAKLVCAAECFAMLSAANAAWSWNMPLATIARIWRNGSTIRSRMFEDLERAYSGNASLASALVDPAIAAQLAATQAGLRRIIATATQAGVPAPTLSAALGYFDSYRTARLPADVIQAQRDFVGASKYQRLDRDGDFHTEW